MGSDPSQRFTGVYEECYPAVLRYAGRQLREEAALEVVDETFTIAWRRVAELPEPALPWLITVARNVIKNKRRGDLRRWRLWQKEAAHSRHATEQDPAEGVVQSDHIRMAFRQLRPQDQELLSLVGWDGLDTTSVAEVLGLSSATVAVRLHRARKRLEALLSMGEPDDVLSRAPSASKEIR